MLNVVLIPLEHLKHKWHLEASLAAFLIWAVQASKRSYLFKYFFIAKDFSEMFKWVTEAERKIDENLSDAGFDARLRKEIFVQKY